MAKRTGLAKHVKCTVCDEPRPGRQEDGRYFGVLPLDWQFNGVPDEMGGLTTHLTCSSTCRFLGGYERSPFDA